MSKFSGFVSRRSVWTLGLALISALALTSSRGHYERNGLLLYVALAALAWWMWGRLAPLSAASGRRWERLLLGTVAVHIVCQLKRVLLNADDRVFPLFYTPLTVLILGLALTLGLWPRSRKTWVYLLMLVSVLGLFVSIPLASPHPSIDVWIIQQQGAESLLAGDNPYAIEYPDIYGPDKDWYPGGKARYYPYPPLSLLLGLAGQVFGDVRWILMLCHLAAAAFLYGTARRLSLERHESFLLALLLLLVPRGPLVIEQSWTEPALALALSVAAYGMAGQRSLTTRLALGTALALKQTMILLLPFLLALWPRWRLRDLPALVALPLLSYGAFLVWDARALVEDVVLFHWESPFRADGLTLSAFIRAELAGPVLPSWLALAALALGALAWSWRVRQAPAGTPIRIAIFWLGLAATFLTTLLLGKHAFCNYFYLVHVLIALSLVWSRAADRAAGRQHSAAGFTATD